MELFDSSTKSEKRNDNVDAKESGKLSKVRRREYVRVGEVNILNHSL